jgi:hypothetical protein
MFSLVVPSIAVLAPAACTAGQVAQRPEACISVRLASSYKLAIIG